MRIFYTLLLCAISASSFAQTKTTHTVYFDFNQNKLPTSAEKELMVLLEELKQLPVSTIVVKGYADQSGSDSNNQELSKRRADNVASILQQSLPQTVSVLSEYYGEKELLTSDEASQHLNRRVVLSITYQPEEKKDIQVEAFFQDVEEEKLTGDLSDTIIVKGKQGTTIKIPPGSLQTKTGEAVNGKIEVRLKEYYDPGDILLAGMHSVSNEGLLQTGGMFKVVLLQGGDTLSTETKKEVEIRMPIRNNSLSNMNVFVMNQRQDSSGWKNTRRQFSQTIRYWDWPWNSPRLLSVQPISEPWLHHFQVGRKYTTEYSVHRPLIGWGGLEIPSAKKVWMEISKLDSTTIQVKAKVQYRRKGYKRLGIRSLDTTFTVPIRVAEYYTAVRSLNYINCDRFLKNRNNTEFYVKTPGFKGLNVIVYFKSQSAYMHAENEGVRHVLYRIPAEEKVVVVAYGRSGDTYYFAKQPSVIAKKSSIDVLPQKMSKEEFEIALKAL